MPISIEAVSEVVSVENWTGSDAAQPESSTAVPESNAVATRRRNALTGRQPGTDRPESGRGIAGDF
ncbi:MAG: hypothetical protein Q4B57_02335 [Eubacteriales bacterium]|nr:hypothetical protein [Eubacteriales bacterium]